MNAGAINGEQEQLQTTEQNRIFGDVDCGGRKLHKLLRKRRNGPKGLKQARKPVAKKISGLSVEI